MTNQQLKAHCEDVIANPQDHLDWVVDMAKEAFAALNQSVSPELKLPDGWVAVPMEPTEEMIAAWRDDMDKSYAKEHAIKIGEDEIVFAHQAMLAAAPAVPHTAPIEPICATGGAEWVSIEDEPPRDGSWCIAIEEGDLAGDVVYWENGAWKSEFGRDEYTHWMYHPAAPEEE
ncbi:hypothetical protein AAF463_11585 [Pantoea sp. BJ2]|uniref:DUF551 domain-containing protein n=1 Tax=Pantoea sp. BJ2 TaxID=3141322 RepID=A0AAU7TRJ9_9GAMM